LPGSSHRADFHVGAGTWDTGPIDSRRNHGQDRPQAPRAPQEGREPRQAPEQL